MLDRNAFCTLPERRQLDSINTISPRIPLRESRLVQTIGQLKLIELASCKPAHLAQ
jgi:hypothetical protein